MYLTIKSILLTRILKEVSEKLHKEKKAKTLLTSYGASVSLFVLEIFVPMISEYLTSKQRFSEKTKVKMNIFRRTILKLFGLFTYIASILAINKCPVRDECNVGTGKCLQIRVNLYNDKKQNI